MICEIKNKTLLCNFDVSDGKYIVDLRRVDEEKSIAIYRRNYFSIIDTVSLHTGDNKQEIHARLKNFLNIASTTTFSREEWIQYLQEVKQYFYQNLDLIF